MDKFKVKELKQRIKAKDTNAMVELAKLYGGTEKRKGFKLYLKAAKHNNANAQFELATHYYIVGCAYTDFDEIEKAQYWCQKAIDNGNSSAESLM